MFKLVKGSIDREPDEPLPARSRLAKLGKSTITKVRGRRPFSVRQWGLVLMVSISLYSLVALANHASFAEAANLNGNGNANRDGVDERQEDYLRRVEQHIDRLEGYLDKLRQDGIAYDSIENFMTIDDVELLLKDVRGDISRLQSMTSTPASETLGRTDADLSSKLADIQQSLSGVGRKAPVVVVDRD